MMRVDSVKYGNAKSLLVDKVSELIKPDLEVAEGDRLIVTADPVDPDEDISAIWISVLWVPSTKNVVTEVIDEPEE